MGLVMGLRVALAQRLSTGSIPVRSTTTTVVYLGIAQFGRVRALEAWGEGSNPSI